MKGSFEVIDIELQLRGPLVTKLTAAAKESGEDPVKLLARSIERMIERGWLDTASGDLPSVLDIENFHLAAAAIKPAHADTIDSVMDSIAKTDAMD